MRCLQLVLALALCSACAPTTKCDPSKLIGTYELGKGGQLLVLELLQNGAGNVRAAAQPLAEVRWEHSEASNQVFVSGRASAISLLQAASGMPSPPPEAALTSNATHALSIRCDASGVSKYLYADDDARVRFQR